MWAIGVARTPIPKDQWPLETVEIEGTPAHYSVARGRRPVNHFQIEPAVNFRNNNGRGFQAPWPRNGVSKIVISARRFSVLRGIQRSENIRETKPFKNSFDTNAWEINPRAALRFRGQIDHAIDMPRSQLLAAASEFSKNPPHEAPGESHR
jgi:hypothetical protein